MKRFTNIFYLLLVSLFIFSSCSEEEPARSVTEYEQIEGTWRIESQRLLDNEFPGDGSTLTFNFCGIETACDGIDYQASEETSGTFSFSFNADKSAIIFEDDDSEAGGNYNGEWAIEEFTSTSLTLSADTGLFGITTIRLKKN